MKRQAERLAPAEVWTLALGFGLAILAQRIADWLQVSVSNRAQLTGLGTLHRTSSKTHMNLYEIAVFGDTYFSLLFFDTRNFSLLQVCPFVSQPFSSVSTSFSADDR